MPRLSLPAALAALVAAALAAGACSQSRPPADTTFAAVQQRGQMVMGVDQYGAKHVFEDLPDGGRIVLDRLDSSDTAAIRTIRAHMRDIAAAFQRGDFSAPGLVHDRQVPGTDVMSARHARLAYVAVDRPRGGEVRIVSSDSAAIDATHRFLAFQRMDHRAAGHEMHMGQ